MFNPIKYEQITMKSVDFISYWNFDSSLRLFHEPGEYQHIDEDGHLVPLKSIHLKQIDLSYLLISILN